jgi:hypothetical protein
MALLMHTLRASLARLRDPSRLATFFAAVLAGASATNPISAQAVSEYELKAAFVYNFARFVEWPAHSFKEPSDPIKVCILGENPFGRALDNALQGKVVDSRTFIVEQISDSRHAIGCHILFVSASERKRVPAILESVTSGVLTVGDLDGFAAQGGVVNFTLEAGKVRFEINVAAAGQQGLRVSSKLLSVAKIVRI